MLDLKKDWPKLAVAVVSGLVGLLIVISMFAAPEGHLTGFELLSGTEETFMGVTVSVPGSFAAFTMLYLLPAIFFVGLCAYTLLKLFGIKIAKFVILGVGVVNLVLFVVAMIDSGETIYLLGMGVFQQWGVLALLALFPLIKGLKKVLCCGEECK